MSADRQLTAKEQAVADIISSHNALISIVFDTNRWRPEMPAAIDYAEIDRHYFNQLANPTQYRPSRSADYYANSWIPRFDIELITVNAATSSDDALLQKARSENRPVLIKRSDNSFSIYSFNYYRDPQWQDVPLTNLTPDELMLLQRFSFDGQFIKKEQGFPFPVDGSNQTDSQSLFILVRKFHSYLPTVVSKMNMKTFQVHQHVPGKNRVTKHKDVEFIFTAKMSTSLMPPDPRFMQLFECDYGIGFLWDINDCNLKKEKYVFARNAGTDGCYWIDLDSGYDYEYKTGKIALISAEEKIANLKETIKDNFTTVSALRENNLAAIKNNEPILWNELVVGLPKGILRAVFATQDVRNARLRALRGMLRAKEKLNLSEDLPLFINQSFYAKAGRGVYPQMPPRPAVYRFYSHEEQLVDLAAEMADEKVAEEVQDILKNQRALAITVNDKNMLDQYLEQKDKVETALLPSEPQWMKLSDDNTSIALLVDMNACELDSEAWASVDSLRAKNKDAIDQKKLIDRNVLPAGLPKNKINAILCYNVNSDVDARLKAADMAAYAKEKLNLSTDIPIYIIQVGQAWRLYSDLEQLMDQNFSRERQAGAASAQWVSPVFAAKKRVAPTFFARSVAPVVPTVQEEDPEWVKVNSNDYSADDASLDRKKRCLIM
jgi:hypothetical protein